MLPDNEYLGNLAITTISAVIFYASFDVFFPILCRSFLGSKYTQLSPKDQDSVANEAVCGVNGAIAFLGASFIFLNYDLTTDILGTDNYQVRILACVQSGYFIADTIKLILSPHASHRLIFVGHHLTCLAAYYVVIVYKAFACNVTLRIINELSTPFANTRTILVKCGMKDDTIYIINGALFMITFFLGRILLLPVNYYTMLTADGYDRYNLLCILTLYSTSIVVDILNIYWFHLLVRGFLKLVNKRGARSKID